MNTDDEYADRLREVLRAEADAVVPAGDGLAHIRERTARRGALMRWFRPLVVVGGVAVIAGGIALGFVLTGGDDTTLHQNPPPPGASSSPTETPTTATPTPAPGPVVKTLTLPVGLPLWPFADGAAAAAGASTATGSPASVALHFTRDHLGFKDNDLALATTKSSDGQQAWVSIGFHTEGTRTSTAAVVHLARWSNDGPWEVVGTRDTTLTLSSPSYGAKDASPVNAGGKITGVDESIRVAVHQASSNQPVGVACCVAAGGDKSPWSETVSYKSTASSVLTIVASTGGHLIEHERWALTAIRNPSADVSTTANGGSAPSTFVAVSQQRIGVFRTSDGSRVRWLTSAQPGGGASDPQHVGGYVYFLRGLGTCANGLARVPIGGGAEKSVYTPAGATISGYGVSATGRLAMNLVRCSDSQEQLLVRDPATGKTHSTPYSPAPPKVIGDPTWAPDNTHLAVFVRGGTSAVTYLENAFTMTGITAGSPMCGENAQNPAGAIAYSSNGVVVATGDNMSVAVVSCANKASHDLLDTPVTASGINSVAITSNGWLIAGGPDTTASKGEDIVIWKSGTPRHLQVHGVSQPRW